MPRPLRASSPAFAPSSNMLRPRQGATQPCRERARPSGLEPCPVQPLRTRRSSLPSMPPRPPITPWIAARDLAILLLLYGSGLRVAEALSLLARVLPIGATLRVTGKRSKTRVVPVLPAVREAIEDYVAAMPISAERRCAVVRRRAWRSAQPGPRAPIGGGGAATTGLARDTDAPCSSAQLCNPPAGSRSGPARASGTARSREPFLDTDLYGGGRSASAGRVSPRPPPRLSRGPAAQITALKLLPRRAG